MLVEIKMGNVMMMMMMTTTMTTMMMLMMMKRMPRLMLRPVDSVIETTTLISDTAVHIKAIFMAVAQGGR